MSICLPERMCIFLLQLCLVLCANCSGDGKIRIAVMTELEAGSVVGTSAVNAAKLHIEEKKIKEIEIVATNDSWNPAVTLFIERFARCYGYPPAFIGINVSIAPDVLRQAVAAGNRMPGGIRRYILGKNKFDTGFASVIFDGYGDTVGRLYLVTDIPGEFK